MQNAAQLRKSFAIKDCQDQARRDGWSNEDIQRCAIEKVDQPLEPSVRMHCVEQAIKIGATKLCDMPEGDLQTNSIRGVNYNSPEDVVSAIKEFCNKDSGETAERDGVDDAQQGAVGDSKAELARASQELDAVLTEVGQIQAESDAWVDLARGVVGRQRKAKDLAQAQYDRIPVAQRTSSFEQRHQGTIGFLTDAEKKHRQTSGILRKIKKLNNQIGDSRGDIMLLNRCLKGAEKSESQLEEGYFAKLQAAQQKYLSEAKEALEKIRRTQSALDDRPSRRVIQKNLDTIRAVQARSVESEGYALSQEADEHHQCARVLQGQQGPTEEDQ